MLFPPINFAPVEDGIYRSGVPTEINFQFLDTLNLRTIIHLFPDGEDNFALSRYADENNIKLTFLGDREDSSQLSSQRQSAQMITEEIVIEAMSYILNKENFPLLFICSTGEHRTGTVAACLRKLQRWNLTSIFEEYRRFTQNKRNVHNEQFIELFDIDLLSIPEDKPSFLDGNI